MGESKKDMKSKSLIYYAQIFGLKFIRNFVKRWLYFPHSLCYIYIQISIYLQIGFFVYITGMDSGVFFDVFVSEYIAFLHVYQSSLVTSWRNRVWVI